MSGLERKFSGRNGRDLRVLCHPGLAPLLALLLSATATPWRLLKRSLELRRVFTRCPFPAVANETLKRRPEGRPYLKILARLAPQVCQPIDEADVGVSAIELPPNGGPPASTFRIPLLEFLPEGAPYSLDGSQGVGSVISKKCALDRTVEEPAEHADRGGGIILPQEAFALRLTQVMSRERWAQQTEFVGASQLHPQLARRPFNRLQDVSGLVRTWITAIVIPQQVLAGAAHLKANQSLMCRRHCREMLSDKLDELCLCPSWREWELLHIVRSRPHSRKDGRLPSHVA